MNVANAELTATELVLLGSVAFIVTDVAVRFIKFVLITGTWPT
jgi:hypothetical protein